jgi:hypothetical protein
VPSAGFRRQFCVLRSRSLSLCKHWQQPTGPLNGTARPGAVDFDTVAFDFGRLFITATVTPQLTQPETTAIFTLSFIFHFVSDFIVFRFIVLFEP